MENITSTTVVVPSVPIPATTGRPPSQKDKIPIKTHGTNPFVPTDPRAYAIRVWKDIALRGVIYASFLAALVPLVALLWLTISKGTGRLFADFPYFLNVSMNGVYGGTTAGGIYHAILGTLLITLWAGIISVPIGIFTAVYLVEFGKGRLAKAITFFVDVMTGIPSVVAGLFAAAMFSVLVGPAYRAGIMGAVALSLLMAPTVVRGAEEMIRLVPLEIREAALALGVPRWRVITKVVLRTAAPGITATVLLAVARVIGETAPLLLTVGVFDKINGNVFSGRMMTLPVYVYQQYDQGLVPCRPDQIDCLATINYDRAWAAAIVLILIVMALNLCARLVSKLLSAKK